MNAEAGYNQSWSEMLKTTRLGTVFLPHSDDFTCWNIVNIMDDWRVGWHCVEEAVLRHLNRHQILELEVVVHRRLSLHRCQR